MKYKIGIVGATGIVGQEMIRLLLDRSFPFKELRLFASAQSTGKKIAMDGHEWIVEPTQIDRFSNIDLVLMSAGAKMSNLLAADLQKKGCIVIDNSSAFRMDDAVPLVIPEINPDALEKHQGIIANPNCSTAIALMALCPLHKTFGLRRFFAATYQAVSGSGAAAIGELKAQTQAWSDKKEPEPHVYPHPIAFNLIPEVDAFLDNGYTKEEYKMLNESRKILNLPALRASTTCVRVPVFRTHSIAINAEFAEPIDVNKARAAIEHFEGAELCDVPEKNQYPTPVGYTKKIACGVGRLRRDSAFENGLAFWVSGDQLWKGAALNAIQIAECLDKKQLI